MESVLARCRLKVIGRIEWRKLQWDYEKWKNRKEIGIKRRSDAAAEITRIARIENSKLYVSPSILSRTKSLENYQLCCKMFPHFIHMDYKFQMETGSFTRRSRRFTEMLPAFKQTLGIQIRINAAMTIGSNVCARVCVFDRTDKTQTEKAGKQRGDDNKEENGGNNRIRYNNISITR